MFSRPGLPESHQTSDGGWGGIQDRDPIPFDLLPNAVGLRIAGTGFRHKGGRSVHERRVNDIGMSGDPTRVRGAPVSILILNIEHILEGAVRAYHVTAMGMHNRFRL